MPPPKHVNDVEAPARNGPPGLSQPQENRPHKEKKAPLMLVFLSVARNIPTIKFLQPVLSPVTLAVFSLTNQLLV